MSSHKVIKAKLLSAGSAIRVSFQSYAQYIYTIITAIPRLLWDDVHTSEDKGEYS